MSDEVIRREFPVVLEPSGDGRTLDLRIVPYNVKARVSDGGPSYEEEWAPGVFRNKHNRPSDVLVNVEHEKGFAASVARCIGFSDTPDGFDGEFRMLGDSISDKALELVNAGVFTGVSVEAIPIESKRTEDGVVRRIAAKIVGVALCRSPAFPEARVLAVREAPDDEPEPAPEPEPEPDRAHIDETLERIGVKPLARLAVVDRPWDKTRERFTDEEYERSCLVEHSFPVLEPSGELNREAMRDAAKRLNSSSLAITVKGDAARKLIRYYRMADEEPSAALKTLATR